MFIVFVVDFLRAVGVWSWVVAYTVVYSLKSLTAEMEYTGIPMSDGLASVHQWENDHTSSMLITTVRFFIRLQHQEQTDRRTDGQHSSP